MKRVQRKRIKGWRMPPNTKYVGRPTKWGNPYTLKDGFSREQTIEAYRYWLSLRLEENPRKYNLDELQGKDLACWCPLDKPCHVDVLLEILQSLGIHAKTKGGS